VVCVALGTLALEIAAKNQLPTSLEGEGDDVQVSKDGTLMRGVDDLTVTETVAELRTDGSTLGDLVDGLGHGLNVGVDSAIADDVVAVHILDGLES